MFSFHLLGSLAPIKFFFFFLLLIIYSDYSLNSVLISHSPNTFKFFLISSSSSIVHLIIIIIVMLKVVVDIDGRFQRDVKYECIFWSSFKHTGKTGELKLGGGRCDEVPFYLL